MATSLAQHLRELPHSSTDSVLFCHHPFHRRRDGGEDVSAGGVEGGEDGSGHNLTYAQCHRAVDDHGGWLRRRIGNWTRRAVNDGAASKSSPKDVTVAYLADNEPDLLLSVLACTELTATANGCDGREPTPLPAMLNVRWTPREMERALRPSRRRSICTDDGDDGNGLGVHVTILLYGAGYEIAAVEAVRLMNDGTKEGTNHFAVAESLPNLSRKYYEENAPSSAMRSEHDQRIEPVSQSTIRTNKDDDGISNKNALVLFTSGTSSPNGAKGVLLSHQSLLVQAYAKTRRPCQYDRDTAVVATTVPWFHVGGISSALAILLCGGCLVFPPANGGDGKAGGRGPSFEPGRVLQSILPRRTADHRDAYATMLTANTLVVVPAMLHAISDHVRRVLLDATGTSSLSSTASQSALKGPAAFPNVRLILVGGQSIGDGRLRRETRALFPNARIVQTYACTEAGSSMTFEDLGRDDEVPEDVGGESSKAPKVETRQPSSGLDVAGTCVGSPPDHIEIAIFDAEKANSGVAVSETTLPHGTTGVIGTRGPHVMSGYWNRGGVDGTINGGHTEQWMLTNDLGYIDPRTNKLHFCGRANDVIRTGGESVLATEVERVLDGHADVEECAVFALPDDKFGEAVCAAIVIVPMRDANTDAVVSVIEDDEWTDGIRRHCADHQLAGFKRPRRVFRFGALPRNSSGKVLKHEITRLCASQSKETSPERRRRRRGTTNSARR